MNARTILNTAITCVLVLPASVRAQDTDAQLKKLEQQISQLTTLVGNLTDSSKQVADNVDATSAEVMKLRADLEALTAVVNEQEAVVRALTERDSAGNPILSLRANMEKSEAFRQELDYAVHQAIRKEGEIRVSNKTTNVQSLKVNNRDWLTVQPGETKMMKVPVGTVTTELVGQEAQKSWTIGTPNYSQAINIEPASEVTTLRPSSISPVSEVTVYRETVVEPAQEVTVWRPAVNVAPVQEVTVFRPRLFERRVVFNPPVVVGPPVVYTPPVIVWP